MVTSAPGDWQKTSCKESIWLHWAPPSPKPYILTFPNASLERSLRAIWGAVSQAAVLILPLKNFISISHVVHLFSQHRQHPKATLEVKISAFQEGSNIKAMAHLWAQDGLPTIIHSFWSVLVLVSGDLGKAIFWEADKQLDEKERDKNWQEDLAPRPQAAHSSSDLGATSCWPEGLW